MILYTTNLVHLTVQLAALYHTNIQKVLRVHFYNYILGAVECITYTIYIYIFDISSAICSSLL